ncbi:MAG: transposase [Actinomycetota bacterium]|nr:transposase [Actinomycetota bacterium]
MARPLRIEYPGALYHITSRGNDKNPIFLDDEDRDLFLDLLHGVNKRYHFICHAYCLMDNHYHLLIETPEGNLSSGMRQLNGVYTQAFNKKHKRAGHLLQGRYKALLVDKDSYLLEVARYIVLNPVRARLVNTPEERRFSSYQASCGLSSPHPALTLDLILAQFGKKRSQAQKRFSMFVKAGIEEESTLKKTKGQILLGEESFVKHFAEYLKGEKDLREIPKSQRYLGRPTLESLFTQEIVGERTKRNGTIQRAVEEYGYTQKEIADHLGLHYSTVSRLMKENEERSKSKT